MTDSLFPIRWLRECATCANKGKYKYKERVYLGCMYFNYPDRLKATDRPNGMCRMHSERLEEAPVISPQFVEETQEETAKGELEEQVFA